MTSRKIHIQGPMPTPDVYQGRRSLCRAHRDSEISMPCVQRRYKNNTENVSVHKGDSRAVHQVAISAPCPPRHAHRGFSSCPAGPASPTDAGASRAVSRPRTPNSCPGPPDASGAVLRNSVQLISRASPPQPSRVRAGSTPSTSGGHSEGCALDIMRHC